MNWIIINKEDINTYPSEGEEVIVSDEINYDIAWYIMSGEYRWVKTDVTHDTMNTFTAFEIIKWKSIN